MAGRAPVALALLALAGACELPTSVPRLDQQWVVPGPSVSISVAELLPASVGILPDSSGFSVSIAPVSVTRTLSQDCAACATANGTTVPKPAFTATVSATSALPAGFVSATLSGGSLVVAIRNNFNFDPLRPSATARGYAVIAVTNNGATIGRDSVNGADLALAPGTTLTRFIPLAGSIAPSAPLSFQVTLFSPAGDPVTMDASRTIVATATPTGITVASASISVNAEPVSSVTTFGLSGIDSSITTRVDAGRMVFDIANPFNVAGNFTVQLTASGVTPVVKTIVLTAGASHRVIDFDRTELQRLLGHDVTITVSGPVSSVAGAVTVTPKQVLVAATHLDITLHTGG